MKIIEKETDEKNDGGEIIREGISQKKTFKKRLGTCQL